MFRIGEAYWEDAPEEVDREQEYTEKAVEEWRSLIDRMPDSDYSKKARELVKLGTRRIAESIEFITDFYCKQELYHACAYRAIQLADEYGEFSDLRVNALENAVFALNEVADAKEADPDSDKNLYFKTMTATEIRARSKDLGSRLEDYKKAIKSGEDVQGH